MSATSPPATAAAVRRPFRSLRFTRDDELVRLVRAGDERAFEAMYDRHHRGILSFCRHMLGSAEEAEDAVQHTFIAAHRDLVGSDKPIQLKAWLYTIARNRSLSILRARREERALDDVPEPSVEGLSAAVQRRQDLRELLGDLQRLPDDQRAALVLSELGALSHEEIGTTLGVRKDKVKALVFQARESLASSRAARDADCQEIQEQLAVLRGGSLRRTTLRRHVEVCPACAAFKAEVQRQRGAMAAILPVLPSMALKDAVLGGAMAAGGAAAGGGGALGGGLVAASGAKALVVKIGAIAAVAGGATGGGLVAVDELSGGSGGNTATAMTGVPEQRSVQLVADLRQRAERTAAKRESDHRAAREARPAATTEASTTARARPISTSDAADRGGDRAQRRGTAQHVVPIRRESREASSRGRQDRPAARTNDPPKRPPPAAPAPAPVAAPPAQNDQHDVQQQGGHDDGDDGYRGRKWKKGKKFKRRGPKSAAPAPPAAPPQPAPPPARPAPSRDDDHGDEHRGPGRGHDDEGDHQDGGDERNPYQAVVETVTGALPPTL